MQVDFHVWEEKNDAQASSHLLVWPHPVLGHKIPESGDMACDAKIKRALYIGKSMEVRDIFNFTSPPEVLTAQNKYYTSCYGCLAGWDLGSAAAKSYFAAQQVGMKLV